MKIISFKQKRGKTKPIDLTESIRQLEGEDHEPVVIEPEKEIWFKIVVDISEEMQNPDYDYIKRQLERYSLDHPKITVVLDLPGYLAAQEKNSAIWDEFLNSPSPEGGCKPFPDKLFTDPYYVEAYESHNGDFGFLKVESEGIITHENFIDDTKATRTLLRELRKCTDYHEMLRIIKALDIFWN